MNVPERSYIKGVLAVCITAVITTSSAFEAPSSKAKAKKGPTISKQEMAQIQTQAVQRNTHLHSNGCHSDHSAKKAYNNASAEVREIMSNARNSLERSSSPSLFSQGMISPMAAMPAQVIIPVVVHVVHDWGPEYIGEYQITDAIEQMNEDYAAWPYAGSVDGFGHLQTDIGVTFKLATLDPQGAPTSGITYTQSYTTYDGTEGPLQSTINWPREKYLNVWVVNSSDGTGNGSAYSNYPSTVDNGTGQEFWDGIVVSYWAMGRTGSAISTHHKIMTHEAGHWLNLKHIWGDVYNNGDYNSCSTDYGVNDTPNTSGNTGCYAGYTCGSSDNSENFMDYGTCTTMFSYGQSDRMRAALASHVADRNNLWTTANLIATGLMTGNVPPVANANGPYATTTGSAISFSSAGSSEPGGTLVSYEWSFGDGRKSTQANPTHTYASNGSYSVTLTVTDDDGETGSETTTASVFAVGAFISSESEPNDSSGQASGAIGPISKIQGSISHGSDDDWFYFDLTAPDSVKIDVSILSSADLDFWVYHESDLNNYVAEAYGNTNLESVSFQAAQAGRYFVYVDGWGGETSAYEMTIQASKFDTGGTTTPTNPVASINGPYTGSIGQPVQFSSSGSSGSNGSSITEYRWSFGDGSSSASANPTHAYSRAGNFDVSLTVTDSSGATGRQSTTVAVTESGGGTVPDACASGSPQTSGTLEGGVAMCLGSDNTMYFSIEEVNGYNSIAISTGNGSGDLDIEYSNTGWPNGSNTQGSSAGADNSECIYMTSQSEYWGYLKVSGSSSGATVIVDFDTAGCR